LTAAALSRIPQPEHGGSHSHAVTLITKRGVFVFLKSFLASRVSDGDVIAITVLMILPRYRPARQMKHTLSFQPIVARSKSNMV
jgi:hypothetical protein